MFEMKTGSIALYMMPVLSIVCMLIAASAGLMRKMLPQAFNSFGYRRLWSGYAAMMIPILMLASFSAHDVSSWINEVLVETAFCYLVAALIGMPALIVLKHFNWASAPIGIFVVFVLIAVLALLGSLNDQDSIDAGLRHWYGLLPSLVVYGFSLGIAFCLGARIPFSIEN